MARKTYSIEYKIQAVKRVTEDGKTASQVSKELGINVTTLREHIVTHINYTTNKQKMQLVTLNLSINSRCKITSC